MTDNAGLSTVMNVAAADDVGTDALLCPSLALCLADGIAFGLGAVLDKAQ